MRRPYGEALASNPGVDLESATSEPEVFYVLVCRDCDGDDPHPIPFPTAAKRGRWASEHTKATGHSSWLVLDQKAGH